ncbi:phosphoserine phosphatase SerB [Congregibacter variabilis]|uniref:Phosphoserine phosphatase n=1 Tax=Congregibacter variabilis TaxID=3081200 RepID=A0ABZ0I813_9GAMM|nr:phosphoserine phosphatase SerB [Congregibacter sp. IMCC43200]
MGFSLPATLSYSSLQWLLPELALADTVHFVAEPPVLVLHSETDEELADRVAAALSRLGLSWQAQAVSNTAAYNDLPLYQNADAVLTLIVPAGGEVPSELMATLAQWNVELRGLRRLSLNGPGQELALELYLDDWARLAGRREALQELATRWEVDLMLAPSDSKRPRRRLIAFDMDSTLIQCEVIDELARRAGVGDEVAAVTASAMRGELDFRSSFRERMSKLRGLHASEIHEVSAHLPLMPGARSLLRTLRSQGHYTVILSGGFDYFAKQVQTRIGVDEVHANQLQIVDEQLSGEVNGEIVDGERKVLLLTEIAQREGFDLRDTVAVGDGANDLPMLAAAGLGVAFHAKPLVRKTAPCAVSYSTLEGLLYLLGVPRGGLLDISPD